MKATQAQHRPAHAAKEPFARYLVLSAVAHGVFVVCVVAAAWLWGRPAYYKPPAHTVSLVDVPFTLRQTTDAAGSKQATKEEKKPERQQPVVQATSTSKPAAAQEKTTSKKTVTEKRTKPAKAAKVVTPPPKKRPAAAKSAAKSTKKAKVATAPPKKKKPVSTKKRSPSRTRSTRAQSVQKPKAQQAVATSQKRQAPPTKRPPPTTTAQQRAAEKRLAALRERFGGQAAGNAAAGATAELLRIRLQAYQERVREEIIDAWILPMAQEEARDLQATALLIVGRDGHIAQFEILQPSGNALFDDSLLRTIQQADPLPALPDDYGGKFLEVEMRFKPYDS